MGIQALGMGLGTSCTSAACAPISSSGHDFRGYSATIKMAVVNGPDGRRLYNVHDIGLALSPMAYFAQFALDVPAVAMVTASHNDNGWTGVKMGMRPPADLRAGRDGPAEGDRAGRGLRPERRRRLPLRRRLSGRVYIKDLVRPREAQAQTDQGGRGLRQRHGGAFAPKCWSALGAEVIPLDVRAGPHVPALQPEPGRHEDAACLRDKVLETGADVGLGFDGDGDRCGVVDNEGERDFRRQGRRHAGPRHLRLHPGSQFVVDVKSTGLFMTDPVLAGQRRQDRLLEDRPLLHQAAHHRTRCHRRASRSPATISSTSRSAAVMTTAWSRPLRFSTCSTATRTSRWRTSIATLPQDLGLADHVAAMRRRGEIRCRRPRGRPLSRR
jgi:phosphomannomutase/phosphoglucomutase